MDRHVSLHDKAHIFRDARLVLRNQRDQYSLISVLTKTRSGHDQRKQVSDGIHARAVAVGLERDVDDAALVDTVENRCSDSLNQLFGAANGHGGLDPTLRLQVEDSDRSLARPSDCVPVSTVCTNPRGSEIVQPSTMSTLRKIAGSYARDSKHSTQCGPERSPPNRHTGAPQALLTKGIAKTRIDQLVHPLAHMSE
jgi:hypothetical protein